MNPIIYDVIIAVLLLIFLWRGYSRGFILTLCGFLALFVALIGASIVSNALAEPVAHTIQPIVEQHLQQTFQESLSQTSSAEMDLPIEEAIAALQDSSLYQSFAGAIQSAVDQGLVDMTANTAHAIAGYLALQLARIVLFAISFLLVLIVWFLLSHALDLAFHLPVLSSLNHWSGALLGLIQGALLLFIAAWLLEDSLLPPDIVSQTYLLRFFCTTHPLELLAPLLSQFSS